MHINFTKKAIEQLDSPEKSSIYHYDKKTRGLGIRVTRTGIKTFIFYRWIDNRPERITIGRFPEISIEQARGIASKYNAEVAQGNNPAVDDRKSRSEWTFGNAFDAYIERHAKHHNKTWQEEVKNFERYLKQWRNRKLSSLHQSHVQKLHNGIGADRGQTTANRTLELIRVIFNKAINWGEYDDKNPSIGISKFKTKSRDRFLQSDEIERFMKSLAEEQNENARDMFLLCLFTGARKSNVLSMRWEEIDFNNSTWKIPETKNGDTHSLPLISEAMSVLFQRYENRKSDYVFPNITNTGSMVSPNKVWKRVLKRANIDNLRIHDLRRTMGSWQAITGTPLPIISKTLAHKDISTTSIYARINDAPVRASMEKAMSVLLNDTKSESFLTNESS